jgi:hypothetical protein
MLIYVADVVEEDAGEGEGEGEGDSDSDSDGEGFVTASEGYITAPEDDGNLLERVAANASDASPEFCGETTTECVWAAKLAMSVNSLDENGEAGGVGLEVDGDGGEDLEDSTETVADSIIRACKHPFARSSDQAASSCGGPSWTADLPAPGDFGRPSSLEAQGMAPFSVLFENDTSSLPEPTKLARRTDQAEGNPPHVQAQAFVPGILSHTGFLFPTQAEPIKLPTGCGITTRHVP